MTRSIQTETRIDCDACSNYYTIDGQYYDYHDDNNRIANWHRSSEADLCPDCWDWAQKFIMGNIMQWTKWGLTLIDEPCDPFYAEPIRLDNDT